MKAPEQYEGFELRAWRHQLKISLTTLSRVAAVNTCELSYVERGVSGADRARVKLVQALTDIEAVIARQRPINLDDAAIERSVRELRRARSHRTRGRTASASSAKVAAQAASA